MSVLSRVVWCAVLLLSGCSVPELRPVAESDVTTEGGTVVGVSADERVVRWLDIPYAQPPVGERRWRAPVALQASNQLIERQSDDIMCPQMPSETSGVDGDGVIGQEDCLYLDVVAPADFRSKRYPVMFWIHGGGNTAGRKGTYDFTELAAREDVVVVTINYRLGPLGWMTHSALQKGAEGLDRSSNFGTLDIIAALEWTGRNIAQFGGDPGNVTVFGESAGGHNIYALLVSPLTDGLFHKAIVQSGYTTDVTPREAVNREREFPQIDRGSWEWIQALGEDPAEITAAALRAVPAEHLLETYYGLNKDHISPLTTADGVVIPEQGIASSLADSRYSKNIPVIAGSNRDEVSLWLGLNRYFVEGTNFSAGLLPPRMRLKDAPVYNHWVSLRSRGWKARGVDEPLRAMENAGYTNLWSYRFDWDDQDDNWLFPFSEILGAAHGAEIAFVMGGPMYGSIGAYMYPDNASAREMTDRMMAAWGNFAHLGMPGEVDGKPWPPYGADGPYTMILDSGDDHGIDTEFISLETVLAEAAEPSPLDGVERCLLAWELLINIGRPQYDGYASWHDGECADLDPQEQKRRITEQLVAEYGSVSLP